MEENFTLEDWFYQGAPPPPPSIPKDHMILELAFHEAGHLVLGIIGEKLNLGFSDHVAIKISPDNPYGNFVTGFHSPYPDTDHLSSVKKKEWYTNGVNTPRLFVKILVLLGGYTSYQAFIEKTEYFVNPSIESNQNGQASYFKLDSLPDPAPSDFERIREMLGWINQNNIGKLARLQKVTFRIMRNPSVSNAIRFVKNYLKQNINREITLPELNYLKRVIRRQTKKIDLLHYSRFF